MSREDLLLMPTIVVAVLTTTASPAIAAVDEASADAALGKPAAGAPQDHDTDRRHRQALRR